jgi:hypothetical protein
MKPEPQVFFFRPYECSDEGTCTPNIRNSFTCSHASQENHTRNLSKNCECKQALTALFPCRVKLSGVRQSKRIK